jgi:hypothetical protein
MKTTLLLVAVAFWAMPALAADPSAAQINAAFSKADADHDGTVSQAEAMKFGITAEAFDKANTGKDKTLDKTEFLSAVKYQFDKADPNKDGTISRKEAATAGVANHDKDGTLDLAEYLHALTMRAK